MKEANKKNKVEKGREEEREREREKVISATYSFQMTCLKTHLHVGVSK
jgi:hypothetical protein